jgi:Icc-related predicted phosphoesterase
MQSIGCMSDTHGQHWKVNTPVWVDIMIHAGDITMMGEMSVVEDFLDWYSKLPYTHKILIAGNHDFSFERDNYQRPQVEELLKLYPDITYLEDSGIEIEGLKIWGTPYVPNLLRWAFSEYDADLQKVYDKIPHDTNILVSHGPSYGILDQVSNTNESVGSTTLARKLPNLRDLKLHVFGHIHEAHGYKKEGDTLFMNASMVDRYYHLSNHVQIYNL